MKKYKGTLILTYIIILLPILIGCLLWNQLPDQIATHFSFDGTPNDWSAKPFVVFGIPVIMLGFQWVCFFFLQVDPKKQNMSEKLKYLVLWIVPCAAMLVVISSYGYELGYQYDIRMVSSIIMGLLFLIIGNYMPKCKQNYTMGIRLPWTLDDEENWNHTHRIAGIVWVIGGFIMLLNIFIRADWLPFVLLVALIAIPTIYSYLYYKKQKQNEV